MVFLATMSAIYRNRLEHSGPRPCIYWNITWFLRMRCNRYVALAEWSSCCGISVIMYIPIHTVMCMELLCDAFYVIVGSCITCLYFTVAYWFLLIILAWHCAVNVGESTQSQYIIAVAHTALRYIGLNWVSKASFLTSWPIATQGNKSCIWCPLWYIIIGHTVFFDMFIWNENI